MMKTFLYSRQRGFTLIEVLLAMSIFSLMMVSVSQTFARAFSGYRSTKVLERDLESTQFALNIIGKELRTSSVVAPTGVDQSSQSVQFFDHSQNKCIKYRINNNNLEVARVDALDVPACAAMTLASFTAISTGTVSGVFRVTSSASVGGPATRVGKVVISLDIVEGVHHAYIQTTAALRDFGNINL